MFSSFEQGKHAPLRQEVAIRFFYTDIFQLRARKALDTGPRRSYEDILYGYPLASGQESIRRWEPRDSANRFWISQRTHCTGHLQGGNLQSRATDFESRNALIALWIYRVGTYSLKQLILELASHSRKGNIISLASVD